MKQNVLVRRDEKGEVLPVEMTLPTGETILIKPRTIGTASELKLHSDDPNDPENIKLGAEVLAKHLVDPALTVDEILSMKVNYAKMLLDALNEASGTKNEDVKKA